MFNFLNSCVLGLPVTYYILKGKGQTVTSSTAWQGCPAIRDAFKQAGRQAGVTLSC